MNNPLLALDPHRSVVVEACAGSGKTWLLVSRLLRLLLDEVEPQEILAITFTRKAANEMQARLTDWLTLLATDSDEGVRDFLRQRGLDGEALEHALPRARRLYETVLSTRPGITLTTFHAWFYALLRHAPLNQPHRRASLVEKTGPLRLRAWLHLRRALASESGSADSEAFLALVADIGLHNLRKLLDQFLARRAEWWAWSDGAADPLEYTLAALRKLLPIAPDADPVAEVLRDTDWMARFREYQSLLLKDGGTNTAKRAATLDRAFDTRLDPESRYAALQGSVLTQTGKPIQEKPSAARTKRLGNAAAERFLDLHAQLGELLLRSNAQCLALRIYRFNALGLRCALRWLAEYEAVKAAQGVIDFGDVEWRAARLIRDSEQAATVQYRLDARYRHLLLDEFQDTNPLQWQILNAWLQASGEAGRPPQIFLVGDPKQSIYRFRGAESRLFSVASDALLKAGGIRLEQDTTRRLAPPLVEAVNRVFLAQHAAYPLFRAHHAANPALPGYVEILPHCQAPDTAPPRSTFRLPLQDARADAAESARHAEARQLVQRLQALVGHWLVHTPQGVRPLAWQDVLILVRRRSPLMTYEAALRTAGIPFTTTRRGGLLDTLEAGDLHSLLSVLATPWADLPLLRVLKSPIFDITDAALASLAASPGDWWTRVQSGISDDPALAHAARLLAHWQTLAGHLPVHDLLDRMIHESDLEARYAAAVPATLAASVRANLDAFMNLALNLGAGRFPSLAGFLDTLAEQQRSAAEAPDEGEADSTALGVRILTVHEAKGLESPLVWLLDCGPANPPAEAYGVLSDWPANHDRPQHFSLLGDATRRGAFQTPVLETAAAHEAQEDFNRLYVAMTRARQILIASGAAGKGKGKGKAGDWLSTLRSALQADAQGSIILGEALPAATPVAPPPPSPPATPGVSVAIGSRRLPAPINTDSEARREFGILLHRLLELRAPPARDPGRETLARQLGHAPRFDEAWAISADILGAPALARFFDPAAYLRARNELPLATAHRLLRIDRLVEFAHEAWILDYKSALDLDDASLIARHQPQLSDYRQALAGILAVPLRMGLIRRDGSLLEIAD
jgi:ATP-dependent helicase/nuclease subunit A